MRGDDTNWGLEVNKHHAHNADTSTGDASHVQLGGRPEPEVPDSDEISAQAPGSRPRRPSDPASVSSGGPGSTLTSDLGGRRASPGQASVGSDHRPFWGGRRAREGSRVRRSRPSTTGPRFFAAQPTFCVACSVDNPEGAKVASPTFYGCRRGVASFTNDSSRLRRTTSVATGRSPEGGHPPGRPSGRSWLGSEKTPELGKNSGLGHTF